MTKIVTAPTDSPSPAATPDASTQRPADGNSDPPADAFTQIREARDKLVASVIDRAVKDGCHQRAKWLFEFGGIMPQGHKSPADEPSLARLLLDQFHIPESDENIAAEFSANDPAVE